MSKIVRDKFSGILRDPSGGLNQKPVNKNTLDSKGVLNSFIKSREVCWSLENKTCWLLPNGEAWLIP